MSVVRLVLMLVTALYACTCAVVLGVVMPPLHEHLLQDLTLRSRAEAATVADEVAKGLFSEDGLEASLRGRAARSGWHDIQFAKPAAVAASRPAAPARWGWGWNAAQATVRLVHDGRDLGALSLTASSEQADGLMRRVAGGMVLAFAALGFVMMMALLRLSSWAREPLAGFHDQLHGLSERRFVSLKEPKVLEWVELSKSLNVMVSRVRLMLNERDQLVNNYQDRLDHDALTQTKSRESFMERLRDALAHDDGGGLAIVRVHDLEGLNRRMGRARTDDLLVSVATILRMKLMQVSPDEAHVLARLNGADFGVLLKVQDPASLREHLALLSKALSTLALDGMTDGPFVAWIGGSTFIKDETFSEVLLRADAMVGQAATQRQPVCTTEPSARHFNIVTAQWRLIIENALETGRIQLETHAVVDFKGRPIHREAMLRLVEPGGNVLHAVDFIPPAIRCGRVCDLDLKAVELALAALAAGPGRIAVNLAQQSLALPTFLRRLAEMLQAAEGHAHRLCFEVRELDLIGEDWHATKALCRTVEPFGCEVGIDHFGLTLSVLPLLETKAIRYVKLSPRFSERIPSEPAVRAFLGVLLQLTRRLGIQVIGNGVTSRAEADALQAAGADGFTGPVVAPLPPAGS